MIYISIPAHNEARTLGILLWKIRKVLSEFGRDYEVVVLDDASTDDTAQVLAQYEKLLPLRVLREKTRLGYPAAMERLLRDAENRAPYPKRDVVVTLQADFTENPADLVPLVKAIEGGADVVAGTPDTRGKVLPRPLRVSRWLAPLVLGKAFRKAPVSDPLSGFRAYRVIVLRKIFRDESGDHPLRTTTGWGANLELLARAAPHARRIEETPYRIRLDARERESRFQPKGTLKELLSLRGTRWPIPNREGA